MLLLAACGAGLAEAQVVDRTKYPDYNDSIRPDATLMRSLLPARRVTTATRPDHVNNAETRYFPPVFNQDGGSCGSASRICYMFSHELNAYRDLDGKDPDNYYPSHFSWLLTNGNSGKDEFVAYVGIPSASVYGGQTYSKYFGNQDTSNNDFGWMQGYDKWYSAMFNRMWLPSHFPLSVQTEEGREAVKQWLWNHSGDSDFKAGGIVGIGVASQGQWESIPSTPENDAIGVTGMKYVKKWGTSVDHALTIVGYDDRIEFDLNGNGVYGETAYDEKGAWIIVNSWGAWWCNQGFVYCPYAHGGAWFTSEGALGSTAWWQPEIYRVRKNYRPLRTIKIKMDYDRRSELYLSAGVSTDLQAAEPQYAQVFDHFKYAGDGNNGNTVPAPEVPMLGRWADGQLHAEPMEFGYDLTDLSAKVDQNVPVKYFFKINTKQTAVGSGHIYNVSIIDYNRDEEGIEVPCQLPVSGMEVKNAGEETIVTVTVPGRGYCAPRNAAVSNGLLTWDEPVFAGHTPTGYRVYCGEEMLTETAASVRSYTLPSETSSIYEVSALYGEVESARMAAPTPVTSTKNSNVALNRSGFRIPDVFGTRYTKATIEYWINCNTLADWNQSAGPGWGNFMLHANANGTFTAGWDTNNRLNAANALKVNTWRHIALVVDGNTMTAYVNGLQAASVTSDTYSGIGGFGDLVFSNSTAGNGYSDCRIDEIRIWKTARTAEEIAAYRTVEIGDAALPADLVAYFKGDLITVNGKQCMRDHTAGAHHAEFLDANYGTYTFGNASVSAPDDLSVAVSLPEEGVFAGIPATLSATTGEGVQSLKWTVADIGVENLSMLRPTLIFPAAGNYEVSVTAVDASGNTETASTTVSVQATPAPNAAFTATKTAAAVGERISFLASDIRTGYRYLWQTPGADSEETVEAMAGVTYDAPGTYTVSLTATAPDGQTATTRQAMNISPVLPVAMFDVSSDVVVKGEPVVLRDQSKYAPTSWNWILASTKYVMAGEGKSLRFIPEKPGVYDVILTVSNEVGQSQVIQERALTVCNADSKNGLNFTSTDSRVTATAVPVASGQQAMTIDWWMRPGQLDLVGNGIGDAASTWLLSTSKDGELELHLRGDVVKSSAGLVTPYEWHHYAVAYDAGSVYFYRDGELAEAKYLSVTSLPELSNFSIGTSTAPFAGQIDEFRVWSQALGEADLRNYCNQPIEGTALAEAESSKGLKLYYRFDQSGGDVLDATSQGNNGVRSGFGPDGDAWGLSKGVFCLNFEDTAAEDVTETYLQNYAEPFQTTGGVYNSANSSRFLELADWTRENEGSTSQPTGAHVDYQKNRDFTITTEWDGFATSLSNHKAYQTVYLPAGVYRLTANYGEYEGESSGCYLVAAIGSGLPDTDQLPTQALAYIGLQPKSDTQTANTLYFVLPENSNVSLGVLANMSGKQCVSFSSFSLTRQSVETLTNLPGDDTLGDVTSAYLRNYTEPFETTGNAYNTANATRFLELAVWTRENEGNTSQPTGAHVDTEKNRDFTITTEWDGFASSLTNHKVYQTVYLPAGVYEFTAEYGDYEGQSSGCYLVAAIGTGLPDTDALSTQALAYTDIVPVSSTQRSNTLTFSVPEGSNVSLGVLANMSGRQCLTFRAFSLVRQSTEPNPPSPDGIAATGVAGTRDKAALYDLFGRRIYRPTPGNVYIRDGRKVVIR